MQTAANEFQEQHQQEIELAVATASILPGGDCYEHNGQVCVYVKCVLYPIGNISVHTEYESSRGTQSGSNPSNRERNTRGRQTRS